MSTPVRLGCVVPAHNVMVERDFMAMGAQGVSVHFARADIDYALPLRDQLEGMIAAGPDAARVLAKADVRAICFACTSASFLHGPGSDEAVAARMAEASGTPCVTTSTAILRALAALGARSVAVATPYVDWLVEAETEFLEAAGVRVAAISGMQLDRAADINAVPLEVVVTAAEAIDRSDADALFISCTDLAAIGAITELEARLAKPVITSNQAGYWALSQMAGAPLPAGWGTLMSTSLA